MLVQILEKVLGQPQDDLTGDIYSSYALALLGPTWTGFQSHLCACFASAAEGTEISWLRLELLPRHETPNLLRIRLVVQQLVDLGAMCQQLRSDVGFRNETWAAADQVALGGGCELVDIRKETTPRE